MNSNHKINYFLNKRDLILLVVLLLIAIGIRLYYLQFVKVIAADGVAYAITAKEIIEGEGIKSILFPPFYPILIALMSLVFSDFELSGQLVSILLGSFIVVPVYLIALEFFNRKVGVIACFFAIAWPSFFKLSCEVLTQPTYTTLLLLGIYLTWQAFKKNSILFPIAAGVVMAFSYLTRPEAFIVFFAITIILLTGSIFINLPWKKALKSFFSCWLAFFIISSPYLHLIHEHTGTWQLTAKSEIALNQVVGSYLNKVDLKTSPDRTKLGYMDIINNYPEIISQNTTRNITATLKEMAPPYMYFFFLLGFAYCRWNSHNTTKQIFLLSTFSPLIIIIPFFFISAEYIQPHQPIFFLYVGQGFLVFEKKVFEWLGVDNWGNLSSIVNLAPISLGIVIIQILTILLKQIQIEQSKPPYNIAIDRKHLGHLLAKHLPKDAMIMTRWGRIGFYSGRGFINIPQTDAKEIIAVAKKEGASYIVLDGDLKGFRPQFGDLYNPLLYGQRKEFRIFKKEGGLTPFPFLKLFLLYKDPNSYGMIVYKIKE